jgi:hypothetical protein
MPHFPLRKRCGFNWLELLLIFAVVGVLVGLLLPALQKVREAASKSHCTNNLRQIGAGFHRMHAAHGKLPPALGWYPITVSSGKQTGSYGNPFFHLLPYIEQDPLYKSTVTDTDAGPQYLPWKPDHNAAYARPVKTFTCPSDPGNATGVLDNGWAGSSYAYNFQVFGTVSNFTTGTYSNWAGAARIPISFPDGTSSTIVVAEKFARCGSNSMYWGGYDGGLSMPVFGVSAFGVQEVGPLSMFQVQPAPFSQPYDGRDGTGCDPRRASTGHTAGMLALFDDGRVKTLSGSIEPIIWWYRCTPPDSGPMHSGSF